MILAVCSKNNEADAKEPFERHPETRLKLDDFAVFIANWDSKTDNLVRIAETLNIGLDSLVFVDDNPVECAAVRRAVPQVDVIALPADPAYYTRTLSRYLMFETARSPPRMPTGLSSIAPGRWQRGWRRVWVRWRNFGRVSR